MQDVAPLNKALSANAKVFIPNRVEPSMPSYMTNCYPFVTITSRGAEFAMNGRESANITSPLNPFMSYSPQLYGSVVRPPVPFQLFNSMHMTDIPNQFALHSIGPHITPKNSKLKIGSTEKQKKKKKSQKSKKNIVIQPSGSKNKKSATVALQTYFAAEIADKVLVDSPSPLYCGAPSHLCSTSEESDSGYSSPMHRLQLLRQQQQQQQQQQQCNVSTSTTGHTSSSKQSKDTFNKRKQHHKPAASAPSPPVPSPPVPASFSQNSVNQKNCANSYSNALRMVGKTAPAPATSDETTRATAAATADITTSTPPVVRMQRKRKKRYQEASKLADAELRDIDIEQHVIREIKNLPIQTSRKPRPTNISLNFADMVSALEKTSIKAPEIPQVKAKVLVKPINPSCSINITKRGKEREIPKLKKPSTLKRVILKEREEKKRLRLLDDPQIHITRPLPSAEGHATSRGKIVDAILENDEITTCLPPEDEQDTDTTTPDTTADQSAAPDDVADEDEDTPPLTQPQSPISQVSPFTMSPIRTPGGATTSSAADARMEMASKLSLHSRRFREFVILPPGYCNQVLDKDIDEACTQLLKSLVTFQDNLFNRDPVKAKFKRRIVLGLREVTKHLKLKKLKCVIISPNLESIESKGGLDEALNQIMQMCTEQCIPFLFALGRKALGRVCGKLVSVSVVGIFSYDGADEQFNRLVELTKAGRTTYNGLVLQIINDNRCNSTETAGGTAAAAAGVGGMSGVASDKSSIAIVGHASLSSHNMLGGGHSRNASSCSAISFISSILSEPICDTYNCNEKLSYEATARQEVSTCTIPEYHNDDNGHEADTEDEQRADVPSVECWLASSQQPTDSTETPPSSLTANTCPSLSSTHSNPDISDC